MKVKFLNYLLEAVLQAMLAVCWEIKFERKTFKLLIGGSTASNACSMQRYKNISSKDSGGKTCTLNLRVYNVLYLRISAPLYEARCSKNSDKDFLYVRHRSKAYILVCIASEPASVPVPARV